MAKGTTYWDYAGALAIKYKELSDARNANNKSLESKISNEIQILRYKAYIDGIDLYELHRDTYHKAWAKYPSDDDFKYIYKQLEEIPLWKQLVDIQNRYLTAPAWEKDNIHQEGQQIRMRIYSMGLDVNIFSERAFETTYGRKPNASEEQQIRSYTTDAVQQYNKLKADEKKAIAVPHSATDKKRPKVNQFNGRDRYGETYSGADMSVYMAFPGYKPLWIGTASTVSYTVYREKKQVRTLGRISAKGITKGTRTISGRLIFTIIAEHIVESLRREIPYLRNIKTLLMDELPPFDLLVSFGNEYGSAAGLVIQGITTVDEQKTMSVEDLFTENIFTYLARALEPMRDMHASRIDELYEPLTWYTSDFRHPYSEEMAKFKVKDLIVYKESLLLVDPNPFIGGPEEWDSADAPAIASSGVQGVTSGSGSSGSSGSSGGSTTGGGKDGKGCKIIVKVYDANNSQKKPISGATVNIGSHKLTTDSKGEASYTITEAVSQVKLTTSKSGYDAKSDSTKIVTIDNDNLLYESLPLYKQGGKASPDMCGPGGDPDAKELVGEVRPFGYWYDHGATTHIVVPTKNGGKDPQFFPNPSVKLVNYCGGIMSGVTIRWEYNIVNWSDVKNNKCWAGWLKTLGCIGQVSKKSNIMVTSVTDGEGKSTMPNFDFGLFPKDAFVEVIVKPLNRKSSSLTDVTDESIWVKFYFQLGDV